MFFSHTAGSLGSSVWGVLGHVARTRFSLCFPFAIALCVFSVAVVLGSFHPFFLMVLMAKDTGSSRSKSRAAEWLEPYNNSLKTCSTE